MSQTRSEMRRGGVILVLGILGLAGAAAAGGLGTYGALFPTNPCQDGWVACEVDGESIDPGLRTDGEGRPLPSDMRLGWFDLEPTAALSPFVALSDYDPEGELPPRAGDNEPAVSDAAVAEEIARIEAERQAIEAERQAELERMKAQEAAAREAQEEAERLAREQEERRRREEAERRAREEAEAAALAEARSRDAAEAERLAREQEERRRREEAERKAREEAERKAREEAERLAREKAEAEAREAERLAREEAARKAEEEAARKAEEEAARREAERLAREKEEEERRARQLEEDKSCDDLAVLEPAALMGRLREGQVACLETRFAAASQTEKDKISRVLMVNAESAGDWAEWERLIQRHLDEVDRSDPDLCFSYALFLSKGGPARAWATIKWADYALENKSRWTGSTYKARVYNLMQLKAEAAAALWEAAAEAVVAGKGDRAELQETEKRQRGMAKDYAREWLDYARASGQNDRTAMALCVSAAGSKKFCEG